jgi:raffinose/stachyose/melibiose transport system permease protein
MLPRKERFAWQNYVQAWNSGMGTHFLNSILAVFPSLFLILAISISAAFALEVMEAAVLDGASIYKVFYRVALPMVANGLVTIALVNFFFLWNDLLFSLTFISSDSNRTIQTGLLNFTGQYGQVDWGPTFAAISVAVIPTLILYLVLNQQVIKGLASGSLKG